jgi:hypothetical protein
MIPKDTSSHRYSVDNLIYKPDQIFLFDEDFGVNLSRVNTTNEPIKAKHLQISFRIMHVKTLIYT